MLSSIEHDYSLEFNHSQSSQVALQSILGSSENLEAQMIQDRKAKVDDIKKRRSQGNYFVSLEKVAEAFLTQQLCD
jgi:anti-sigma28 factor (negative regulator of flagellin synthesis)